MTKYIEIFEQWAAAFEAAVNDDNWEGLEIFLADDATYLNVGFQERPYEGRRAIIDYLKNDVKNTDRKFDSRTLVRKTPPVVVGHFLSRRWRCTYTLEGAPDLVVEGEARYVFEGDQIKSIEQELTDASREAFTGWMTKYGSTLAGE